MIIFLSPIWDNETERLAWAKCSPWAARLRAYSDILSLSAAVYAVAAIIANWQAAWAVLVWLMGRVASHYAWKIMAARQFAYNHATIEAQWRDENGNICIYTLDDCQRDLDRDKE